jgi:hypothetical protein
LESKMSCQICDVCVIGEEYEFSIGICGECSSPVPEKTGIYLGKEDTLHIFEVVQEFTCSGCGTIHDSACFYCGDMNITEEFNIMFHQKESHWVGGRDAKRITE